MMKRVMANSISVWSNMTCLWWIEVSFEVSILGEVVDSGIFAGILFKVVLSRQWSFPSHGGVVRHMVEVGSTFEANG